MNPGNQVNQVLTERQRSLMNGRMWWVADQNRPYLVKFALDGNDSVMQITDLRSMWARPFTLKYLLEQKNKFAKSLELKSERDLVLLLESLLSKEDPEASYVFEDTSATEISFLFMKRIKIYDFSWNFRLPKVPCVPLDLLCRQIISPLAAALEAQSKRAQSYKEKCQQVEREYMQSMKETERALYKPVAHEEREEAKKFLPKNEGKLMANITLDESARMLCGAYLKKEEYAAKKEEKGPVGGGGLRRQKKMMARVSSDSMGSGDERLNESLERQRRGGRKKEIDFL